MTANDIVMHDAPSTTTVMSTSSVSSQSSSNSASSQVTVNGKPKKSKTKHPKTFQCTGYGDCRMTFTRSEHLARHIRKHTGERPFRCHCNRTFSRLDNLRQHIQTVHANEHHILHAPPPPPLSASSAASHTTVRITDQRNKSHLHHPHHPHHHHQQQPQQHHHMHPQHQLQQPQSHMSLAHPQHHQQPHQHQNYSLDHQKQQPLPPLPQEHFTHQQHPQQQQPHHHQQQQPQQHIIIEHHPVPNGPTFGQVPHHQPQNQQNHAPHPSSLNGSAKHRPQPLALKSSEHGPSSAYTLDGRSSPLSPGGGGPHHKFDTAYPPSSPYAYSSLPSPVPPPPPPPQGGSSGYYHQVPPLPSTPSNQDLSQEHQNQHQQQAYYTGSGASQYSTPPPNPQPGYDASMYRSSVLTPASSRHHSSNISSPASSTTTTTRTTSWLSSVLNDSGSSFGITAVDERPHTWGPSSKRFSSTTDDGGERNSMMSHLISITEDAHISTPKVEGGFASSPMTASPETSKLPPISALIGDQKPPQLSANRSYTKNLILPRPESYPPPKGFPPHGFHSGSMGDNMPSPVDEHSSHGHNVQSASGPSARTTKHLSKPLPPLPADVQSDDKHQDVSSGGMDMLMQAAGV